MGIPKLTPSPRFDALDAEQFEKMIGGKAFRRLWERVQAERARAVERCLREADELELRRAQGAVAALTAALGMPGQILSEMRAQKTRAGE